MPKLSVFPRTLIVAVLIAGIGTVSYIGYQWATEYYHQHSASEALATKTEDKLAKLAEQLSAKLRETRMFAELIANENAPNISALLNNNTPKTSLELATVATKNLFSYKANQANGTFAKIALLDALGKEVVGVTPQRDFAMETATLDILQTSTDEVFLSLANNRYVISLPQIANDTVNGYLVFWLSGDSLLPPLLHGENLSRGESYVLVSPAGHMLVPGGPQQLAVSIAAKSPGGKSFDFYQDGGSEGGRKILQSLQQDVVGTPFVLAYVSSVTKLQGSFPWVFAWVFILALICIFLGAYIIVLRSRFEAVSENSGETGEKMEMLVATNKEREALMLATINELRPALEPLAVVLEGAHKKLANTVVPHIDQEALIAVQTGKRIVENLGSVLDNARKISFLLEALADFTNCEKNMAEHEEEKIDLALLLRSFSSRLSLKYVIDVDLGVSLMQVIGKQHFLSFAIESILRVAESLSGEKHTNASVAVYDGAAVLNFVFKRDKNAAKLASYREYDGIRVDGSSLILLAVAKKVVSASRGKFSVAENEGSIGITVTLPVVQ
ncbi:MAG: hypothetical protein K9K75_03995 [Deltaproteobacteria bacterium]|nr:hypothetical protein [Deltaproteobacteria bacterium]